MPVGSCVATRSYGLVGAGHYMVRCLNEPREMFHRGARRDSSARFPIHPPTAVFLVRIFCATTGRESDPHLPIVGIRPASAT